MKVNNYKVKKCLAIITILFFIPKTYSSSDTNLKESFHCIRYFSYYEKKYKIPRDLLYAISIHETGKPHSYNLSIVWPWTFRIDGKAYYFNDGKTGLKIIKKQISKEIINIDIGCMQINFKYHNKNFKSIAHMINPKYNIEYAAQFLFSKYKKSGNWKQAVSQYHSHTVSLGNKYAEKIFNVHKNIRSYKKKFFEAYKKQNRN